LIALAIFADDKKISLKYDKQENDEIILRNAVGLSFYSRTIFDTYLSSLRKCSPIEYEANLILFSYFCVDCGLGEATSPLFKKIFPILFPAIICGHTPNSEVNAYIEINKNEILVAYQNAMEGITINPKRLNVIGATIFQQITRGKIGCCIDTKDDHQQDYENLGKMFIETIRHNNQEILAIK